MDSLFGFLIILIFGFFIFSAIRLAITKKKERDEVGMVHYDPEIEREVALPSNSLRKPSNMMSLYKTKVVGVTKENYDGKNRQDIIEWLRAGDEITLERDPDNSYDQNAIKVVTSKGSQIGFINAVRAEELAPQMDQNYHVQSKVHSILTHPEGDILGVLISVQRFRPQ